MRSLTIHAATTIKPGETVLAVETKIGDTKTDYDVTLGRYEATWQKNDATHTVAVNRSGIAVGCTCKDRLYRAVECKHMAATSVLVRRFGNVCRAA